MVITENQILKTIKIMEEKKARLKPQAEIEVIPEGPIRIKGNIILSDVRRDIFESPEGEIYLCRCGRSKNKPYCDGSHEK